MVEGIMSGLGLPKEALESGKGGGFTNTGSGEGMKKNEENLQKLWAYIKIANISVTGVQKDT